MKKNKLILSFFIILLLGGCSPDLVPPLGGSYDSEHVNGYVVQVAIQPEDHTFVEHIDNRVVNQGIYEEKLENTYFFKGDKEEFEITLSPDNTYERTIHQLNEGEPIELKNTDKVPTYFSTEFDDVEEYEKLLYENDEE